MISGNENVVVSVQWIVFIEHMGCDADKYVRNVTNIVRGILSSTRHIIRLCRWISAYVRSNIGRYQMSIVDNNFHHHVHAFLSLCFWFISTQRYPIYLIPPNPPTYSSTIVYIHRRRCFFEVVINPRKLRMRNNLHRSINESSPTANNSVPPKQRLNICIQELRWEPLSVESHPFKYWYANWLSIGWHPS